MNHARDRRAPGALAAVLAALLLLWNAPLGAQRVTAPALKAAFLLNFANFVEWPADALGSGQRLSLCVIGDNAVADALEQTIKGRSVDDHALTLLVIKTADGPTGSCHLLYISGFDTKRSDELLFALTGAPIFTVSDDVRFAEKGGVAQLIVENGRVRFAVNMDAARRAHLKISSKLLSLATIVKDPTDGKR
jgi:YfiR/HmsC-like